jgi:hypothetical protein
MRKRQPVKAIFCLACSVGLILGLISSCASLHSPEDWLPEVHELQSRAYGCWMTLEYFSGGQTMSVSGEFLAATPGTLFILNENGVSEISVLAVKRTKLEIFKEKRIAGLWAFLGTLSTASHGLGLIVSAPIWIVSGIALAAAESTAGLKGFDGPPPEGIRMYARFPQGLPKEIDLLTQDEISCGEIGSGRRQGSHYRAPTRRGILSRSKRAEKTAAQDRPEEVLANWAKALPDAPSDGFTAARDRRL